MRFTSFLGGDYRSASVNVACERTVNFYLEQTESPTSQTPYPVALFGTPGLSSFSTGLSGPIRGAFSQDGRAFVVGGDELYELDGAGNATSLGTVAFDENPVSMASNGHGGHQLMVLSAGNGYIYDLNTGAFGTVTSPSFPTGAQMVDFLDGYFIIQQATTSTVYLSALFDGNSGYTDAGQVSSSSDTLQAIRVIQRNLWLFGSERSEVWANTGGTFPFAPIPGSLIEFGIAAPWSLAEADGTLLLVGTDSRGTAMVLQNRGYGFARISTHSEERTLSALPDLANVRAYSYQEQGHTFYVLCPNTGPAMVYDLATGLWHRRGTWNTGTAAYEPPKQGCHMLAFGKHLVGDRTAGTVYEQSLSFTTDAGTAIRRERTAAHVSADYQWLFGSEVMIGLETGLGDPNDPEPQVELSWSKDGGHTFSTPLPRSTGTPGHYTHVVKWTRAPGRFQDLVIRLVTTASVAMRLFFCDLRVAPGTGQR